MQPDLVSFASSTWPAALLKSCSDAKLQPDMISQNILMKAIGSWPMASAMLSAIQQHFLRASMVTYNTLAASCRSHLST